MSRFNRSSGIALVLGDELFMKTTSANLGDMKEGWLNCGESHNCLESTVNRCRNLPVRRCAHASSLGAYAGTAKEPWALFSPPMSQRSLRASESSATQPPYAKLQIAKRRSSNYGGGAAAISVVACGPNPDGESVPVLPVDEQEAAARARRAREPLPQNARIKVGPPASPSGLVVR